MTTILVIVAVIVAAFVIWQGIIVMRGNNYHALARQLVIADVGAAAGPYLVQRPIVEQITNAFRRGEPASSTAMALSMLIRQAVEQGEE
jgi:hypothetical protein